MIYMAIPLAAIGGIFALFIRDMPFSISAGIGFIVLFGIAVLNGLILITGWNELKVEGVTDINDRIVQGSIRRIRPIMLTALTDIFGFLPMAISTSAGAEVQRPLATVVIGGMITATLLTLFVLPILYKWIETRKTGRILRPQLATVVLVGIMVSAFAGNGFAQATNPILKVEDAVEIAIQNNGNMQVARYKIDIAELGKKSAVNIDQTAVELQFGQYSSFENDFAFNIKQNIAFPTVYTAQRKLANVQLTGSQLDLKIHENDLRRSVRKAWYELAYLRASDKLLRYQKDMFTEFLRASQIRYETQATSLLEKAGAEMRVQEVLNNLDIVEANIEIATQNLRTLLNDTTNLSFRPDTLFEYTTLEMSVVSNPVLARIELEKTLSEAEKSVESSKMLPQLMVGYFNHSLIGIPT